MTAAVLERASATSRTAARSSRSRAATGRGPHRVKPKLRVLDQVAVRQRARRRNALLILFIVVLIGFFAVAFVHAELVAGQQDLDAIRSRIAQAQADNAQRSRAAEEAASPRAIVARAQELGMVRAHQPVYLTPTAPVRDMPALVAMEISEEPKLLGGTGGAATAELAVAVGVSSVAPVRSEGATALAIGEPATGAVGAAGGGPPVVTVGTVTTPNRPESELAVPGATVGTRTDRAVTGTSLAGASVNGAAAAAEPLDGRAGEPVNGAAAAAEPMNGGVATSIAGSRAVSGGPGFQKRSDG